MKRLTAVLLLAVFAIVPLAFSEPSFFIGTVDRVQDGNRVLLKGGTMVEYFGIEVPSSRDMRPEIRKLGKKALELNQSMLSDRKIRLEFVESDQISEVSTTRFAYAFSGGSMINAKLLRYGLASMRPDYSTEEKYYEYFKSAQQYAIENRLGIWRILT